MRYNTLLIDADDTLLDFKLSEKMTARETFLHFGLPADDGTIALYSEINEGLWKLHERGEITKAALKTRRFELLGEKLNVPVNAEKMAEFYISALAGKSYLLPGALEVTRQLYGRCRMYIITNGFEKVQKGRLGMSPIAKYFDGVFISEVVGHEKPSAAFFDAVKRAVPGFLAEHTLVVGDSLTSDIAGGIGAGLDVCWFNPKGKPCPEGMSINYIIGDLTELLNIVEG